MPESATASLLKQNALLVLPPSAGPGRFRRFQVYLYGEQIWMELKSKKTFGQLQAAVFKMLKGQNANPDLGRLQKAWRRVVQDATVPASGRKPRIMQVLGVKQSRALGPVFYVKTPTAIYGYTAEGSRVPDVPRMDWFVRRLSVISSGRAMQWLRKNAKLVYQSNAVSDPAGQPAQGV